jgi:hypothetical protein
LAVSDKQIEQRVATSLALGRYLRAVDAFEAASLEFTGACTELREQLRSTSRFVSQIGFRHFLVTSDGDGNFEVEEIAAL